MPLPRAETIERLRSGLLDLVVIGGGIAGARIAYESARAGFGVALIEGGDFGGATSSASSKLIHGGFRYLPMGDIGLVRESQLERRMLMERIAPNLVRPAPLLLPVYKGSGRSAPAVATGLLLYRALAGEGGRVGFLGAQAARRAVPQLRTAGMRMCGVFEEADTIDSRLVLATVKGAVQSGALVLNHAKVIGLELRMGRPGAITVDLGPDGLLDMRSRNVINATGPWVDHLRRLDNPCAAPLVRLSKGVHVLFRLESAWEAGVAMPVMSGRVTMGIPWQGMLMLGTTDTLYDGEPSDVRATPEDIGSVLDEASGFLPDELIRPDRVRFSMAGLRALPVADGATAAARRGHLIDVSPSGLVTVAGGKLTTHRLIARDALRRLPDQAPGRAWRPTEQRLPGTGWGPDPVAMSALPPDIADHLERLYGDQVESVLELSSTTPDGLERIHPCGPDVWAQVAYAFEHEWAHTAEDVARRRTTLAVRGLLTDEIADRIMTYATREAVL